MIFTVFTIIFLPLSFFASVFGINSREWSSPPNNYPTLSHIFTYMVSISLAVIIIALLVAFNRFSRRMAQRAWKYVAIPILTLLRRLHIIKHERADESLDSAAGLLRDLEKLALAERDRVHAKRLSTMSRTHSMKVIWEDQLSGHRKNSAI